ATDPVYQFTTADPIIPSGPAATWPALTAAVLPPNPPPGLDFDAAWRHVAATYVNYDALSVTAATPRATFTDRNALTRPDLARALTRYPFTANGAVGGVAPLQRYDATTVVGVDAAFQDALNGRQMFANDIYRRLLVVTGVPPIPAANRPNPTDAQLAPRR